MGLLSNIFNSKEEKRFFDSFGISFSSSTSFSTSQSLKLSAVYAATNIISNSIAVLGLNIFKTDSNGYKENDLLHPTNFLLNREPSKNISKFNFFKLIITSIILNGNGYALIMRDKKGKPTAIKFIHSSFVTISYSSQTDTIIYNVKGYDAPIESINMLHFFMYSNNGGISGESIITHAENTLNISYASEKHIRKFFSSGASNSGILTKKSTTALKPEEAEAIKNSFRNGVDAENGGVAVLSADFDYKSISVSNKDAELLDSRKWNVIEIARWFNISPVKLYDLTNASYSSLEQTQLSFLEDTIKPYLKMIESELNRKLFLPSEKKIYSVEFDTTSMLSTNKGELAQYYKTLFDSGVLSINEIRKALNYNDIDGGDENFMQYNISTVKNIANSIPDKLKPNQNN